VAIGKDRVALGELRTLFSVGAIGDLTDGQLLERFATDRGEVAERAFATLVERHGPMVLRVCRSVLVDAHDAQDAFQATFLVLVRRARALWVRDSLGPWLHQVAFRTAACARTKAARRRRHERRAALPTEEVRAEVENRIGAALHEEIERLPERYRAPLVLCDLEGSTHEQAARHLGWPVGTIKSRLSRGRERLRDRLARRGFAPGVGLLAARGLQAADALIAPTLVDSTTAAVLQSIIVRTIVRGSAASLARGVLLSMSIARFAKTALLVLVVGATVSGVGLLAQQGTPGDKPRPDGTPKADQAVDVPVSLVRPGNLKYSIIERGNLESAKSNNALCQVEGQTTILSILPEGTKVKKGDKVVELDCAALRDRLKNQQIFTKKSEAAYQNTLLARQTAELALKEYQDGTYKYEQSVLISAIAATKSGIVRAEERLERTRRARKLVQGLISSKATPATPADIVAELDLAERVDAAELTLLHEKAALELAETKLDLLQKYTRPRVSADLQSNTEAKRSNELATKTTYELEKEKEEKLIRQIKQSTILAPIDGIVIYGNDPGSYRAGSRIQIEEGATVREGQIIFKVFDVGGPMRVNTKVHESIVDRLSRGLRAKIHVDAIVNLELTGKVQTISPMADARTLFGSDIKVYTTLVDIENINPNLGLRPGMSAQVEILVAERENVLSVPVSTVLPYGGKNHVAVKGPGNSLDWREVTLGLSNGSSVEVKEGLKDGESVVLDPVAQMSEEEKREKLGDPSKAATKQRRPR
jgi:HlyD family secretion protein